MFESRIEDHSTKFLAYKYFIFNKEYFQNFMNTSLRVKIHVLNCHLVFQRFFLRFCKKIGGFQIQTLIIKVVYKPIRQQWHCCPRSKKKLTLSAPMGLV